jgi:hypothetical protein
MFSLAILLYYPTIPILWLPPCPEVSAAAYVHSDSVFGPRVAHCFVVDGSPWIQHQIMTNARHQSLVHISIKVKKALIDVFGKHLEICRCVAKYRYEGNPGLIPGNVRIWAVRPQPLMRPRHVDALGGVGMYIRSPVCPYE